MKTLLMPVTDIDAGSHTIAQARAVRDALGAHVHMLLIDALPTFSAVAPPYGVMAGYPHLIGAFSDAAEARHQRMLALFAAGPGEGDDTVIVADDALTLDRVQGEPLGIVRRAALAHDAVLFVRAPTEPGAFFETPELIKDALEKVGRPILVLGEKPVDALGRRIAIAWNGSLESARAVSAALPLLTAAERVVVITIGTDKTDADEVDDLDVFLRRHGILPILDVRPGEADVGAQIIAVAQDHAADLLVTGGYTHSRLRQAVLGGVTRTLLARCPVPMLLAH